MRFKFCGDLDCPDWILAEIAIISKLTSLKMKSVCGHVVNVICNSDVLDEAKLQKFAADAKYSSEDLKGCIAALDFIYRKATKFGILGEILSDELQQLGLPKEHSQALCKVYTDRNGELHKALKSQTLLINPLIKPVTVEPVESTAHMKFEVNTTDEQITFLATSDKCRVLLSDLKEAQRIMRDHQR